MRIAIVYDSIFGSTAKIASAIADALRPGNDVQLLNVQRAGGLDLAEVDLLIVGSPTRGFRPTPSMSKYVARLGSIGAGKSAAAFDTRLDLETIEPAPLRWVVDAGGYAATRLASMLAQQGFSLSSSSAGFLVSGTEGPLKANELERAAKWAVELAR
jgi:flavodoxin